MTRQIRVGQCKIGGGAPVSVQSMTNTRTGDYGLTMAQIAALADAGCDIVRVTLNEAQAVDSFAQICRHSPLPVVADIHYDYRLALAAIDCGAAKIRINPGNLQDPAHIKAVAQAAGNKGVPIRIGVNSGSLPKDIVAQYGTGAQALVESALRQAAMLRRYDFENICLSVKASDATTTFEAYRLLHDKCDYPLHIGVTEAGGGRMAIAKSYAALGGLLLLGIGDTLRISLSDDPVQEVYAALELLRAVGMRRDYVDVISCPTCGRTTIDVISFAEQVREATKQVHRPLTVAVMGCVVNGAGEGAHADVGLCGGKDKSVLYVHGKAVDTVPNRLALSRLLALIQEVADGQI